MSFHSSAGTACKKETSSSSAGAASSKQTPPFFIQSAASILLAVPTIDETIGQRITTARTLRPATAQRDTKAFLILIRRRRSFVFQ